MECILSHILAVRSVPMYGFCMVWEHIENVNVSSPQKTSKTKKKNILLIVKYFKGTFLGDLSRETKSEIKKTNTYGTHNTYMHIYMHVYVYIYTVLTAWVFLSD